MVNPVARAHVSQLKVAGLIPMNLSNPENVQWEVGNAVNLSNPGTVLREVGSVVIGFEVSSLVLVSGCLGSGFLCRFF